MVGMTVLRISRKQMATGSVSTQPRRFGSNQGKLRENRIIVKFTAANAPIPIPHGLGFVPTSWQAMPVSPNLGGGAPGVVYSDTPLRADKRVIVLKCSVANSTAEILVR